MIGVDDPYFGKLLYLWIAQGYDRQKITICDFIEWLSPFRTDNKQQWLSKCFEILDFDKDRQLNILNLLHLNKNLAPKSLLYREVILLIDEFVVKNVTNT